MIHLICFAIIVFAVLPTYNYGHQPIPATIREQMKSIRYYSEITRFANVVDQTIHSASPSKQRGRPGRSYS
jgi:hypothetical protein